MKGTNHIDIPSKEKVTSNSLFLFFNRLEKIGANNKGKKDNLIPGKSPNIKNPKDNLFLATR